MIFPVSHADIGDITIIDWDDDSYSAGQSNGTSDYLEWERVTGGEFIITTTNPQSGSLALAINNDNSPESGWINFTEDFEINTFTFRGWYSLKAYNYGHGVELSFMNEDNETIIALAFCRSDDDYSLSSKNGILYNHLINGWTELHTFNMGI
jgi:hypothetical protein